MRLIDATPEICEPYLYDHLDGDHMIAAQNAIDDMPTVDAAPVVRCKDCIHSYDNVGGRCCAHGVCVDCVVGDDFYCADGKRKEQDGGNG